MKNKNTNQRPKYSRANIPPPIRFQERDSIILETIYNHDGVLARRHIKELFWPDKSVQSMENRLSKLYHNGYLNWPNEQHRKYRPIPEPLVWLGWKGVMMIAQNRGIEIKPPIRDNENQMRLLQKRLRKHGIRWVREPNWNQPHHDLAVVDFRLAVERATNSLSNLSLFQWVSESEFRATTDVIRYSFKANDGELKYRKKGVCPDGFFIIADETKWRNEEHFKALFLLEIDMATHDNSSFGIEKAAAGAAYIQSPAYKDRFGANAGRWLVVTTGETRMNNLIQQTKTRVSQYPQLFYFTTLEQIINHNVLTASIWWQVDKGETQALPLT
jgi:hypothetical protein